MGMPTQAAELRYAVRPRVLAKNFGHLCVMLGCLTAVPLLLAVFIADSGTVLRYGIVVAGLLAAGWGLTRIPERRRIQPNEAMTLGVLMFVFSPLLMTFPLTATGLEFADALFEAVSGATTTGLSMIENPDVMPQILVFSRAWMQWYGGLGIVVFSVALVVRPGVSARDMAMPEAPRDAQLGGTHSFYKRLILLYAAITMVGVLVLIAGGLSPFSSVCYALSAVSTGGFAPDHDSMAGLGWVPVVIVTLLTLLCAIPLSRYLSVRFKGWAQLWGGMQLWTILALVLLVSAALFFLPQGHGLSWGEHMFHSVVMGVAAQTTSGFSVVDVGALPPPAKMSLLVSMIIGGGMGSTAGGIKILRLLILFKVISSIVSRASLSRHAVYQPALGPLRLRDTEIQEALVVIILYIGFAVLSWIPFLFYGYDPLDSLFEVISALGTVGLSAGVTGPELPGVLKGVLCADMLLGRLEILIWLVVLAPGTWIGRHSEE
ncbi:MAG: TrkH family potassium uptake protein [Desulfovibrionales bacterium]